MKEISVQEMRALLSRLEEELRKEGELVLTRRGKPIARIQPLDGEMPRPSHADLRKMLGRRFAPSASIIREERDER